MRLSFLCKCFWFALDRCKRKLGSLVIADVQPHLRVKQMFVGQPDKRFNLHSTVICYTVSFQQLVKMINLTPMTCVTHSSPFVRIYKLNACV